MMHTNIKNRTLGYDHDTIESLLRDEITYLIRTQCTDQEIDWYNKVLLRSYNNFHHMESDVNNIVPAIPQRFPNLKHAFKEWMYNWHNRLQYGGLEYVPFKYMEVNKAA